MKTGTKTLGNYLLHALYQRGVRHIFGIPGDFALTFFRAIEEYKKIKLITLSHEPGLGFAADGLSRISGRLSAVAITFGAGALNLVNAVACAYAEKSPLIVISGAPGMSERGKGILFHHQAKSIQSQRNVFKEISSYQATLEDLASAPEEIEKALTIAQQLSSPVYIEIPRDRVFQHLPSRKSVKGFSLGEDPSAATEAAKETAERLARAKKPVLMVGLEVHRFGLRRPVVRLAEKLGIPVVSSFMARATYPVDHPLFIGNYLGPAGDLRLMEMVERSDCLILLGVIFADTNMALRLSSLNPIHLVHAISRQVTISHHTYENVPLVSFLKELTKRITPRRLKGKYKIPLFPKLKSKRFFDQSPLTVDSIIHAVNFLFKERGTMPVVVDNGDCLFASLHIHTDIQLASGYYATMGFAVPAGMGVQIGSKLRPIILVGDGAFQMTGPEISHCTRLGLNPIVLVFNNGSWEMLRTIQPEGNYYDLTPWNFAQLAESWGGRGFKVKTKREMLDSLFAAAEEKAFVIIDAVLPRGEPSKVLQKYLSRVRG